MIVTLSQNPIFKRGQSILSRPATVALIVLSVLWVLFFWQLLIADTVDSVIFPDGDFTAHYFAFSDYQADRMSAGDIPLWNPYNHSGDSFAGNIQFVTWYPPRWVAIALTGAENWTIESYQLEVAVHYLLVSVMAYAFFRLLMKRPVSALIGSVIYTYSGYLTGYPMLQVSVIESVAWTPLVLFGIELSLRNPRWLIRGSVIASVGVALSFLGGHPQTTMQIVYFAGAYLAFAAYRGRITFAGFLARGMLFGGIGISLALIQLLPAWEFTGLSARVESLGYADKSNGFVFGEFLGLFVPRFGEWSPLYIGVAGIILAIGAILRPREKHVFWIIAIIGGLALALGGNSIVYDFFYNIVPGFSTFRQQERAASIAVMALVILATYQVDWLLTRTKADDAIDYKRFNWLTGGYLLVGGLIFIVLMIADAIQPETSLDSVNVFGFVTVISLLFVGWRVWQQSETSWLIPGALMLLIVFDLFTINMRNGNFLPDIPENRPQLPASLSPYVVEDVSDIQWRVDGGAGLQGYGTFFRIPDIYGTGPFWLNSVEQLRQIPVDRFWEVLAVRYATTFDEPPDTVSLELLAYDSNLSDDEFRVFELQDPRPMAHLVYDAIHAQGSAEFAREIMADPRVNLREQAVTLEEITTLSSERPETAQVSGFVMVNAEDVQMTVSTSEDALLTVAIPNYPGWQATVNGDSVDIIDTYAGLIGIPVGTGDDQAVRLRFMPQSVTLGGALSAVTLAGVILLCGAEFLRMRRREPAGT